MQQEGWSEFLLVRLYLPLNVTISLFGRNDFQSKSDTRIFHIKKVKIKQKCQHVLFLFCDRHV